MANTEILFYIIVVVVIIVKLLFWIIYLCVRKRRLRQRRQEAVDTCYEELPAVPQPAYVFSGMSPEDMRHAALIESLPGYQPVDPYKVDRPPPAYATPENFPPSSSNQTIEETLSDRVSTMECSDTVNLIQDDDDLICMQQMT